MARDHRGSLCNYLVTSPRNPGSQSASTDIAAAYSANEVTMIHAKLDVGVQLYEEYMAANRLSVKLLTAAVDTIFTALLADKHTGYTGVTIQAFFEHMTDEYCNIN